MSFQHVPDFHRIILQDKKLRVPKIYVEKYWKGISNPIFLKFPNDVQQEIFWVESNGDIWFQKNWESFAKFLKHGYLLTFKFIGGSYFKVKIFGANTLEINYANIKSVDEGAEATEEVQESGDSSDDEDIKEADESDEESDESSEEIEMPKQAQRNGKRKESMDFDTAQQIFSGGNKVAMLKKARKYPTSEAINVNPFFEITMSHTYANGYILWIPSEFSRKHLIDFKGTATLTVGNGRTVEVSLRYYGTKEKSAMGSGWKLFREKHNLQVDDVCKFEMIQRRPILFNVTITRARNKPSPKKLLGYKEGASRGNNTVKKKDIGGTSRSCPKVNFIEEGRDVMENNTFKVMVKNRTPCVPKEFMKKGYHENIVELKMGRKSWYVKVNFYESIRGCRFSKGWRKFMKACKVKIGDTCLLKLIDERKFVFDVSIIGRNH